MHPGPAYRIETARTLARCFEPADAERLHAALAASREHLGAWFDWARDEPRPLDERVALLRALRARFDRDESRAHALLDPAGERLLGALDVHATEDEDARQIGFWLVPDACGRGLATEAAGALVRTLFEVDGLARVEIRCDADNARSRALAERLGFRLDAELRARAPRAAAAPGARCVFSLLATELSASPAARIPLLARDAAGRVLLDARAERPAAPGPGRCSAFR